MQITPMTDKLPTFETGEATDQTDLTWFGGDCCIMDCDRVRSVFVRGVAVASYCIDDALAHKQTAVQMRHVHGIAQTVVAEAFGVGVSTLRGWEALSRENGLAGLARKQRTRRGLKVCGAVEASVRRMVGAGLSDAVIAGRLGLNTATIWHARRRLGLHRPSLESVSPLLPVTAGPDLAEEDGEVTPDTLSEMSASVAEQAEPPELEAVEAEAPGLPAGTPAADTTVVVDACSSCSPSEVSMQPAGVSADSDPFCRKVDRGLAQAGLLEDAAPLFGVSRTVAGGGFLLAVPMIVSSGILDAVRQTFGTLGPAFYGVRNTFMMLMAMALLRIRRTGRTSTARPRSFWDS